MNEDEDEDPQTQESDLLSSVSPVSPVSHVSPDNLIRGCLVGFSVGDALGSALEFSDRDTLNLITEMEKNYLYDFPAGSWTDKTSELLCMAASVHEKNRFDHGDFLTKFHKFITEGYQSPNGKVFEVNYFIKTTGIKIGQFLKYRKPLPLIINPCDYNQTDCQPLLRIAPIVLKYYQQPSTCLQHIKVATQLTHVSPVCVDACRFLASLMIGALMGVEKTVLLSAQFNIMDITTYGTLRYNYLTQPYVEQCSDTIVTIENGEIHCKSSDKNLFLHTLYPSIINIQKGSYQQKQRKDIISDDQITHTLEAVLWAFFKTTNFENGCVAAVNLALNSSAIGAVYGQLAGVYYGLDTIPPRWLGEPRFPMPPS